MQLLLSSFENHTTTRRDTQKCCKYGELEGSLQTLASNSINEIQIFLCLQKFYKESCILQINIATSIYFQRKLNYEQNLTSLPTQAVLLEARMSLILWRDFYTCAGKVNKELKVQIIQGSISKLLASAYESCCLWRHIFDCRNTKHMQGFLFLWKFWVFLSLTQQNTTCLMSFC